ncbi:hypothetical protein SAMN06265348_11462 [Pedobacter westerhofensis]|uniref:Quercetin 2,3-dioxygenase C-terminal cupin domain-containing protein n=1 Tax=Pedobacter westerhofensis TaxID=425512 RepID=A0A521FMU0_9SPHI|nr:hypothetical protein [Pedobacter westerhofensis]SMO97482.1 hypothetical protein SAMN06265348_11462 [Pedobacter westerhofensis]
MIRQVPAKIFLSDQRRIRQSDVHRSFSTLSYGAHENTHKFNLSKLFVLNDEELAGGGSVTIQIRQASYMVLLPITGDLDFSSTVTDQFTVNVGELRIISLPRKSAVTLSNPFLNDTINYLLLCVKTEKNLDLSALYQFDLDAEDNQLIRLCAPVTTFCVNIGRFKGRSEGMYRLRNKHSRLLSFVISGAFEVEHRLLHMRDGLALSDLEEVDFESLSEGAVLLMIELFGTDHTARIRRK